MNFKDLAKKSKKPSVKELAEQSKNTGDGQASDPRFWKLSVDDAKNGKAIIRFLPSIEMLSGKDENVTMPWVKTMKYWFQGPTGATLKENSPLTIGKPDPIHEFNLALFATKDDEDKKLALSQYRKIRYICNILVVEDEKNPANNGKVFLYEFGPSIMSKISDLLGDDEYIFDVENGANFILKAFEKGGYPCYDNSRFDRPTPIEDETLDKIEPYPLAEFIAEDNYKSYDELRERFNQVAGFDTSKGIHARSLVAPAPKAKTNGVTSTAESDSAGLDTSQVDSIPALEESDMDDEFASLLKD